MSAEFEIQKSQLRQITTGTFSKSWSKFPVELQPDIDTIAPLITIGALKNDELLVHPAIPEPLRSQIVRSKNEFSENLSPSQIAKHDPRTRIIAVRPEALIFEKPRLNRIIYHEVGEDVFSHEQNISYDRLSPPDKKKVKELVEIIFKGSMDPKNTYVCQLGFRKILMEGGYAITDILSQEVVDLNEIFPTAFEMITEQLQIRNGDTDLLEKHIKEGKIKSTQFEDHPYFFDTLFSVLRGMNWKQFLMIFKSGEIEDLIKGFEANFGKKSSKMLNKLLSAMMYDENLLKSINKRLGGFAGV